ncbi:MAG: DUF2141 domain-containing protein [Pseudomonadota bacterium]
MIRTALHLSAVVAGALLSSCAVVADAETAATTDTASLTITLDGIANPTGTIRLGVFAGEEDYSNGGGITGANVTVDEDTETVTIEGLAPGEYGIKLYHDVDDDGDMDTNPFGMPTEPFGFSNNARGRFGPAKWDAARFEVTAGENTHAITVGG